MAKKVDRKAQVSISISKDKGAGWLAVFMLFDENNNEILRTVTAWKNASAAKKCIKEQVQQFTPRKSIKLIAGPLDEKGKPTSFAGLLEYKTHVVDSETVI